MGAELEAMRIFATVDTSVFAAYCQSYALWKQATEALNHMARTDVVTKGILVKVNGHAAQNPLVFAANKAASDMVRYATELGMTPSARARLSGNIEIRVSKFDGLLGAKTPEG